MTVRKKSRRSFGSVRQRRPGARWEARYPLDGRMVPAGTFATKTDATLRLAQIEADLSRGEYRDPKAGAGVLSEWSRRWLDAHEHGLTATTAASYRSILETVVLSRTMEGANVGLGGLPLRSITRQRVKEWLAAISRDDNSVKPMRPGLKASRTRKGLGLLSQILDAAVADDLITSNPCTGIKRPRLPEPNPKILTPADAMRLLAEVPAPFSLLVEILAWGGLRFSEGVELRRRDFDALRGRLLVARASPEVNGRHVLGDTKSHQQRSVPLPRSLVDAITAHLETIPADVDALLFPNRAGKRLHYTTFRRNYFDPACERAGLSDVTPHSLRASCASWVTASDGILEAARRLGHANSSITSRHYARPMEGGDLVVAGNLEAKRLEAQEAVSRGLADASSAPAMAQIWRKPSAHTG